MKKTLLLIVLSFILKQASAQTSPVFGSEIKVTINGLTSDAMEPFISLDGNTLFFNSLNSGGNTNLYYATKINDSTFNYVGLVNGTYDPSPNHLDAVASMDSMNNFFWTSLRSIPNLYRGNYLVGNVSNISKVYGTCNILTSGWIIMDAGINYSGNLLYYSNAYFGPTFTECPGVPCKTKLGVAQKVNDSTFNKTINSDAIFSNVNDTNFIAYAPQVTRDGLELYYTRLLIGGYNTEICVSVRSAVTDTFSLPTVIYSNFGFFPEASSPTTDKQKIYYHQKDGTSIYHIYLRYRTTTTIGINQNERLENTFSIYPNPTTEILNISLSENQKTRIQICNSMGMLVKEIPVTQSSQINIEDLPSGLYFVHLKNNLSQPVKFVKL